MIFVDIIEVNDFIPSKGPKDPAEFTANCFEILEEDTNDNNNSDIILDLLSIRKTLGVKRLSSDYIDIIKENKYKGVIFVEYCKKKNIYILSKDKNKEYINFLKEKRNDLYMKAKMNNSK